MHSCFESIVIIVTFGITNTPSPNTCQAMSYHDESLINEGLNGIARIVNNPELIDLVYRYPLDENAKQRIKSTRYRDNYPFFFIKANDTLQPSRYLFRIALKADDILIKWFFLFYSITSAAELFKERFYDWLDKSAQFDQGKDPFLYRDSFEMYSFRHSIEKGIEKVINIDGLIKGIQLPLYYNPKSIKRCIALFSLTAGYHYLHDIEVVPDCIIQRDALMPEILATTMYISTITGKDFDEVLFENLKEHGREGSLDDVFAMVKKNRAIKEIKDEKEDLLVKLANNNEKMRQQETAGEIISETFGNRVPRPVIEERIAKCNDAPHREILYKLESLTGKRQSFLDCVTGDSSLYAHLETICNDRNVIFSEAELSSFKTVENWADGIILHNEFFKEFKDSLVEGLPHRFSDDNGNYTIETKLKEIEKALQIDVDYSRISNIHTVDDLRLYILSTNPVLNKIKSVLVDKLGVDLEDIKLESSFTNDLGADSLDTVELLMEAERVYGIRIPDEETSGIATVGDLYNKVLEKLLQKNS